ncbi:MAG: hypothetical protein MSA65_06735 [Mollicutes bacterium]|nr:hypothetical protein [Mollicutes bacterium]MDD7549408.1 hypothetical protein [Bacilli bacterium]MDY3761790.1 hypothetical protein [Candidatus Onthovivens sp.]MCI7225037.1 hypothetical protein [Mollicutes bacterium]MCI7527978.1 hypothetical protein [Mollicutes bacterium]
MAKKSKHVPKKGSADKNIIKCIILSIDERSSLTWEMCGEDFSKQRYYKIIEILISKGIVDTVDKTKPITDTSDLVISDHEKADYYTRSNFSKCLDRIEKDLVPLLNLATATMNVIASVKNN